MMSVDTWSERNELLNKFQTAIEHESHGRLSHLSLDVVDGALIIEAHSATYFVVQLVLTAIKAFKDEYPKLAPAIMSFRIDDHPLVLCNPHIQDTDGRVTSEDDSFDDDNIFINALHEEST